MLTHDCPGPLETSKSITVKGEFRKRLQIRKLCTKETLLLKFHRCCLQKHELKPRIKLPNLVLIKTILCVLYDGITKLSYQRNMVNTGL